MTIDKQKIKALADRMMTDRRFCADEYHYDLAEGVLALLAEIERLETVALAMNGARAMELITERDQLKAENEALRKALGDVLSLYEDDEGCRSLPEYIAGRAAMAKEESHG